MKGSGAPGNSRRAAPRSPPCRSRAPMWGIDWGIMPAALACLALLIEVMVGYPDRLVHAIGHPVTWMGRLIGLVDIALNRESMSTAARRAAGAVALVIVVAVAATVAHVLERGLVRLPFGLLFAAVLASTLLAQRSLHDHVSRVAAALEAGGLAARPGGGGPILGRRAGGGAHGGGAA